ncbi:hypothetical protein B566_EDAN012623 [Ephemera danica]|nr:hypothetical protein B566_EDAN012623 [Ephemera danica]
MKSRSVCTLSNCRRGIVLVWFIALILSVPVLFTKATYPMTYTNNVTTVTLYYCNDDEKTDGRIFAVYQLITVFVAPGILMLVCYTYVIRELWRSTRSMRLLTNNIKAGSPQIAEDVTQWPCQDSELRSPNTEGMELVVAAATASTVSNEASRQCSNYNTRASQFKGYDARRARKQVIKMLILVVILFLICWGSRIIMDLMIKVGLTSYSPSMYRLRVALFILPVVHSCINPFIYSFMSKNFRRSLQRQLTRLLCCTGGPEARNRADCTLSRMRTCGGIGVSNSSRTGARHTKPAPSSFSSMYCATENTKHTEVEGIVLLASPTSPLHASNHV